MDIDIKQNSNNTKNIFKKLFRKMQSRFRPNNNNYNISKILYEYNKLYIALGICYLLLVGVVVTTIALEYKETQKINWYTITTLLIYTMIMIIYFLLSFFSESE